MRFVVLLMVLFVFAVSGFSQSFYVSVHDTSATGKPGDSHELEVYLVNLTGEQRTMLVTRKTNNLPDENWTSSMCFGLTCYSPYTDQVGGTIEANDSIKFSITFNSSDQPGYGEALVVFEDYFSGDKDSVLFSFSTIQEPAFELTALDTIAGGAAGETFELGGYVRNLTDSLLVVYIARIQNNLTDGWSSSLCFDSCSDVEVDTVATAINAGDSVAFSVTFETDTSAGEGQVRLKFFAVGAMDTLYQDFFVTTTSVGIAGGTKTPRGFRLFGNYPNPFNPATTIRYQLEKKSRVKIDLFTVNGRFVGALFNDIQNAGYHEVEIDASDLPSGIYYYRVQTKTHTAWGRMTLVK